MDHKANAQHPEGSTMRRLATVFAVALALLTFSVAMDVQAAGLGGIPPKGQPPAGPDGNTPVWRARLWVQVCDYADAGTDNKVLAALNSANYTVLDTPVNDFQRASAVSYDLLLTGVTKLADIQYLKIFKGGSDGVCIARLQLLVNERLIYDRIPSAAQQWLDDEYYSYDSRIFQIPGSTLRAHSAWQAWTAPARPRILEASEMVSRLNTAVGTGMYDFNVQSIDSLSWRSFSCGGYEGKVCVDFVDSLTISVAFLLDYKCIDPTFGDGYCGDSQVPYWAELRFSCTPTGAIEVTRVSDGEWLVNGDVWNITNSERGDFNTVRQYVGPRLLQAFLNVKVPNCAPIIVTPAGDSVQVQF